MNGSGAQERSLRTGRIAAFDGLRGLACALVVLGHSWTVVPAIYIDRTGPIRGIFRSQNLGVTVFFVIGAFLVTSRFMDAVATREEISVPEFWARRLVRIGAQLAPLLVTLLVVSRFDRWDAYSTSTTNRSLIAVATFTFNWALIDNAVLTREDLGHLWYLSVEQQLYVAWVVVCVWLGRFRYLLMSSLAITAVAVVVWRADVLEHEGWWAASLRTTTRADGFCLGALAGLGFAPLTRHRRLARHLVLPALVAMSALIALSSQFGAFAYLQTQGAAFAVVITILVLAIALVDDPAGLGQRMLGWPPLRFVGRISLPLYLWHLPAFYAANRWAWRMDWFPRLWIVMACLGAIVFVTDRWIEQPVARWLARSRIRSPAARTA